MSQSNEKPACGPYCELVPTDGGWQKKLTADGHVVFDQFMRQYDGIPLRLIKNVMPGLHAAAMRHRPFEEIKQAAAEGLMLGILHYIPEKGEIIGPVLNYIKNRLLNVMRPYRRVGEPTDFVRADGYVTADGTDGEWWDNLTDRRFPDPAELAERRDPGRVIHLLRTLPKRHRQFVLAHFCCNLNMREVGEMFGVTRECARQIITAAIVRMKDNAGVATRKVKIERRKCFPKKSRLAV